MFKHILTHVNLDKKVTWEYTLPKAIEIAQNSGAKLHILTTVPDFGMAIVEQFFPKDFNNDEVTKEVLKKLESFIANHVPKSIKTQAIVAEGKPRDRILDISKKVKADLILIAPKIAVNSFENLGITASYVVRHAKCSTLVVRHS